MKKIAYILFFILIGMNLTAQDYVSYWDGKREAIREGSGTESDPYLIKNAQQFAWLVYMINWDYGDWTDGKHFLLQTDIDLMGSHDNQWIPIGAGKSRNGSKNFNCVFDGGFHKITGFYIDTDNAISDNTSLWYGTSAAFFSYVGGVVKNLYLEGTITSTRSSAGFSGQDGTFEYCVSNVEIETTGQNVGGIVSSHGTVRNSANLGNIKGVQMVGGIIGMGTGCIENCYNMGRIEGENMLGGLEGVSMGNSVGVSNSYNIGEIVYTDGADYKGAIVGRLVKGEIYNCYYLEGCIDESNEYGEPKTADFMRSSEFVNMLNNDTDVWVMDAENTNDGYPVFGNVSFDVDEVISGFSDVVVVYPNPVIDIVYVVGDVASCDVFNIVGKRVLSVSENINKISVTDLQSGIYMMRFLMKNGSVVTKKVVKK